MWLPFTPPPSKPAQADRMPSVMRPNPFDDIKMLKSWGQMKKEAEASIPRDAQKRPIVLFLHHL